MTRISKRPVKDDVMERVFQLLFEAVGKKSNKDEFMSIVQDIFSPTERIMIAKRVTIVFLLMKKIDYQTISDVLKVSPSTIAKFQLITENSKGVVKALKSALTNDKLVAFMGEIYLALRGPGTYGANWQSGWQIKSALEKQKSQGI